MKFTYKTVPIMALVSQNSFHWHGDTSRTKDGKKAVEAFSTQSLNKNVGVSSLYYDFRHLLIYLLL